MPQFNKLGIKDIYLVKVARIGSKSEIREDSNDTDPRLIFELEYVGSLDEYKDIKPTIYRTYRSTVLGAVL